MKKWVSFLFFLVFTLGCESPLLKGEKEKSNNEKPEPGVIVDLRPEIWSKVLEKGIKIVWLQGPYGDPTQENIFELYFLDQESQPMELTPEISFWHYGWMPGMGHGTADDGFAEEIDRSRFLIQEFYFNMPGLWDIHFIFLDEDENKVDELIYTLFI